MALAVKSVFIFISRAFKQFYYGLILNQIVRNFRLDRYDFVANLMQQLLPWARYVFPAIFRLTDGLYLSSLLHSLSLNFLAYTSYLINNYSKYYYSISDLFVVFVLAIMVSVCVPMSVRMYTKIVYNLESKLYTFFTIFSSFNFLLI